MTERPNDKAVEAAAFALYKHHLPSMTAADWKRLSEKARQRYYREAKPIVEAAAPHIIEQYEVKRKTKCGHPTLTPADEQEKVLSEQLKHYGVFNCDGDRVFLTRQILAAGFCRESKGWFATKRKRKDLKEFVDELTDKRLQEIFDRAWKKCKHVGHPSRPEGFWDEVRRQLKGLIPK